MRRSYQRSMIFGALVLSKMLESRLIHTAPMQCYTSSAFRMFCRLLSSKAVLWSEMEKLDDLILSREALHRRLMHHEMEQPLVLQVGGDSVEVTKKLLKDIDHYRFDELNLNCGCPSIQAGGAKFGASMMKNAILTRQMVETLSSNYRNIPVSIKCRVGTYEVSPTNGYEEDSYETLFKYVEAVASTNCLHHVVVHARAVVLSGLSPSKNRHVPPLRYDFVHRLASDFPSLRVTLNGGLTFTSAAVLGVAAESPSCDLMIGRDLLKYPLRLWDIDTNPTISKWTPPASDYLPVRISKSRACAIALYADCVFSKANEFINLAEILTPLILVTSELLDVASSLEEGLSRDEKSYITIEELTIELLPALRGCISKVLQMFPGQRMSRHNDKLSKNDICDVRCELKGMLRLMKAAIGTKVANKILRNRGEEDGKIEI